MQDDLRIRVTCPKCRHEFKERVRKVKNGQMLVCPSCRFELHLDDFAGSDEAKDALRKARRARAQARKGSV